MQRKHYISIAFSLVALAVSSQNFGSQELNAIEKQKAQLPELPTSNTRASMLRSGESVDYTKGTFIVNEDWYGHKNSSVNFLSDDGKWTYNSFQKENPGHELGCTSQFGTIYGDNFFIVSKQEKDPGASVAGSRLAVMDAKTMKVVKEFTKIGDADGRSFLGVDEQTGYIGTSNGIYLYDIDKQSIGNRIEGTESDDGGLYSAQIGTMIRVNNRVFAVHQKNGLLVINPKTHQVETTLLKPSDNAGHGLASIVLSKDGTIWASPTNDIAGTGGSLPLIWKVDPTTLAIQQVDIPTAKGIEEIPNSWYAWTADGFCASTKENKIYWKGQGTGSWFTGYRIFCYDIDNNEFYKVFDCDKIEGNWRLYGTGFRIDPVSDDMYCFFYHEFLNPEHELAIISTDGRGEKNGTVKGRYPYEITNYWFPALPVFPDNEKPVIQNNAIKSVTLNASNSKVSIPLEEIVKDGDNMTAAIVTTASMSDEHRKLIRIDVQNCKLTIQPIEATVTTDATIPVHFKFNSNGKITETDLTVTLESGAGAPFEVNLPEVTLDKGKTITLAVKGMENETATWESSNTNIATVSNDGVITAIASGMATITATSTTRDEVTAQCKVTVKREDLVLDASELEMFDNGQTKLIKVSSGFITTKTENITWKTSDENIVSITSSNPNQINIKTLATGTVEIIGTISMKDDEKNTPIATTKCIITVNKLIPVERIELKPVDTSLDEKDPITLEINKSVSFTATIYPENASIKTIKWSSSTSSFTVVDGVVTAKGNGSAIITATSNQGGNSDIEKSASVNVSCSFELEKVHFEKRIYGCNSPKVVETKVLYEPAQPSNLTVTGKIEGQTWKVSGLKVQAKTVGEGTFICNVTDKNTGKTYTDTCKIICSKWANSFTLEEDNKLLNNNDTYQITYKLDDSNLTDEEKVTKKVLFTSNNPDVASVSEEGLITANKKGDAVITAYISDGSYYQDCHVLVGEVWATKVVCQQDTVRVKQGETVQLSATIDPQEVSFPIVTWSSNSIEVTPEGLLSGSNVIQKQTVKATSLDKQASDSCIVYVIGKTPLTGLNISPNELSIDINDVEEAGIAYSKLFTTNFLPGNATLAGVAYGKLESIISSDENILKVNSSTLVESSTLKPNHTGNVRITVIAGENNIQDTVVIHVTDRSTGITGISLDASNMVHETGERFTIGYHVSVASNAASDIDKSVEWESSNPEVATIDSQTGEIKTITEGETMIRATTKKGSFTTTCRLSVSKGIVKVTGVSLNTKSLDLAVGTSAQLTATITPENAKNQSVNWSSSNKNVVTINDAGYVTAHSTGTSIITVTTVDGGFTATCQVSVSNPTPPSIHVTGVKLNTSTLNLEKGETAVLKAIVSPTNANNKDVAWHSSNPAVASVNGGTVTASIAGTSTITVTTDEGNHTATCEVTVTDPDLDKPLIEAKDSTATLTFQKVEGATKYEVSVYKYSNEIPVLSGIYTTDADGNIISGLKSNLRADSPAHIAISLQQLEKATEYIVKIVAIKEKDGKTDTLGTFFSDPFTTSGSVDNEDIGIAKCSILYINRYLYLTNLEQSTCHIITLSGNIQKIIDVTSSEEKHPLYLPKGVYIVTAIKDNKRISKKILINN